MSIRIMIIAASVLSVVMLSACGNGAPDDNVIDGKNLGSSELSEYVFDIMSGEDVVEDFDYNLFEVALSNSAGETLVLVFAYNDYYLPAGEYSAAATEMVVSGKYIADDSYLETGSGKLYINDGNISVTLDSGIYGMSGSLTMSDDTPISFTAEGTLSYSPLNEYQAMNIYSVGVTPHDDLYQFALLLASEGVAAEPEGDGWIYSGNGIRADLTLISSDITLGPGIYPAEEKLQNPLNPDFADGTFVKGYEYKFMEFIPMQVFSNVFNVVDGVATWDSYIDQGQVKVEKKDNIYRITMECGDFQARFQGRIPDLEENSEIVVIPEENLTLESEVLGKTLYYNIMLPEGYYDNATQEYPILYLLHGMTEDHTMWMDRFKGGNALNLYNEAYLEGTVPEMIVVMPQAFDSFYRNADGLDYETYFQQEFIPFIESTYRVKAEKESRFIAGNSMGGYGATRHSIIYPEKFALCYSMSGGFLTNDEFVEVLTAYRNANGSFDGMPVYFIECGTEDILCSDMNEDWDARLTEIDFPHTYIKRPGGHNGWPGALERAFIEIGNYLKK